MKTVLIGRYNNVIYTRKHVFSFIFLALICLTISGCSATGPTSANGKVSLVELNVNTDANQTANAGESGSNSANAAETAESKGTPTIKGPNLFNLLRQKMKETPAISAKELASHGNELIKQHGFNFGIDLRGGTDVKNDNAGKESSADAPSKFIDYNFTLTDNSKKTFRILNPVQDHPCGTVLDMPLTKITEKTLTLVTQIDGRSSEQAVQRSKDMVIEEVHLIDAKNNNIVRKWFSPIDSTPVGISADGTKIYLDTWEFSQDTTDNYKEVPMALAIEIDKEGNIKFVDAKEIPSDKGERIEMQTDASKQTSYGEFTKFKVGGNEYILFYEVPCT